MSTRLAGLFDLIFDRGCFHVLAPERREEYVSTVAGLMKPGGYLFLSESCEAFIRTWTVRWFFRHPEGVQRPAEGYLKLVRDAGFVFDEARDVRTSTPWWSLWDFGFTRKIGLIRSPPVATELLLVARK